MWLLWVVEAAICAQSLVYVVHANSTSTSWVASTNPYYNASQHMDRNSGTTNNSEWRPCGCIESATTKAKTTPQAVITTPSSLHLQCQTSAPYEVISWWLVRCSEDPQQHKTSYQITEGPVLYLDNYELSTNANGTRFTSTLIFKNTTQDTYGIYQCFGHAKSAVDPFFTKADNFIFGKLETMQQCLRSSRSEHKKQFTDQLHPPTGESLNSMNNRYVFDFSDGVPDPRQG